MWIIILIVIILLLLAEIFALLKDHIDEALMELSDFKTTFGERGNSNEKSDG